MPKILGKKVRALLDAVWEKFGAPVKSAKLPVDQQKTRIYLMIDQLGEPELSKLEEMVKGLMVVR
jgi:hypothetical protein